MGGDQLPAHGLGGAMGVTALAAPAAAAAGPATAAPGAPAAATGPGRLRVRDLDSDPPPVELTPVELRDRVVRLLGGIHFHEAESARLTGKPVGDDGRRQHVAALSKELA